MANPLMSRSFLAILFIFAVLLGIGEGARSPPGSSLTATSTSSSSALGFSLTSFKQIVLDALRQLFEAPMKIFKLLLQETKDFLRDRDLRELFDMKVLKQLLSKVPKRLNAYYEALIGLESHCIKRTVCDIAEFTSRRIPKWMEQIAFIYFNTFSETKPLYQVIVHAMTVKNCPVLYSECNPEEFLARLRNNITQTITSTVAPLKAAMEEMAFDTPVQAFQSQLENPRLGNNRPAPMMRPQHQEQQQQLQMQQHQPQQHQQPNQFRPQAFENNAEHEDVEGPEEFEALMNERRMQQHQQWPQSSTVPQQQQQFSSNSREHFGSNNRQRLH